ncbi:unnamed protein product [Anisakis simplex]|uniref:High mobility group protein 1.2 (inferred by orthology to a C. elegans protein) n=1 Tax=Anisakis simplex TaxID=6269 RepID=A0A0M3IZ04_ANISI|nr:unnamed protein product [Anisakis simplex]
MRESAKPPVRGKTSPYGFFVKMCYEEHKKKYPNENVQVTEISKKCSEKWKTMSDDEKRRFFELAQKDAERYQAEVAAYGGEDLLRKRKRVKKDPNAPKRALLDVFLIAVDMVVEILSAFFFFSHDKRPEVQQQHPDWKVGQVAQELGRFWKALSDEDRMIYERKALEDKERYAEEMRNYKQPKIDMRNDGQQQQQQVQMQNNGMMDMGVVGGVNVGVPVGVSVAGIVKHPGEQLGGTLM